MWLLCHTCEQTTRRCYICCTDTCVLVLKRQPPAMSRLLQAKLPSTAGCLVVVLLLCRLQQPLNAKYVVKNYLLLSVSMEQYNLFYLFSYLLHPTYNIKRKNYQIFRDQFSNRDTFAMLTTIIRASCKLLSNNDTRL